MDIGESLELEETKIHDKEGDQRWIKPVVCSLSKVGGSYRYLFTARDVTERKEAYRQARYLNRLYRSISKINKLVVREDDFATLMAKTREILEEREPYAEVELARFGGSDEETIHLGKEGSSQWSWEEGAVRAPNCVKGSLLNRESVVVDYPEPLCRNCDFDVCRDEDYRSIALPLASKGEVRGAIIVRVESGEVVLDEELELLEEVASDLAYAEEKLRTEKNLEETTIGILGALSKTVEKKDRYTGAHIDRVRELALAVGEEMGLPEERMEQLRYASELHDLGKVEVPDSILGKEDDLTEEEWAEMRRHPKAGEEIVADIPRLEEAATFIGQHHEYYDGSGYPHGLAGEEIALEARIISVADAWDAMRTDRPYREGLSRKEAARELKENVESQFDPEVVDVLLEVSEEGELTVSGL